MYPNTNLQPGQSGNEVKKLQDFLVSKGLMTPEQVATGPGIYGPQTTAAVRKFQEQSGVDNTSGPGYWGPKTISAASGAGNSNSNPNGKTDPDQPLTDEEYDAGAKNNPLVSNHLNSGMTLEQIQNAVLSGDFSGMTDQYGQPFLPEDIQEARNAAEEDNAAYYDALKERETADAESALAKKQGEYQDYLINSGEEFKVDRSQMNANAVNRGVLFSGGNAQRQANLKTSYERDAASKLRDYTAGVGDIARDYQYNYGKDAAKGLSNYYQAGQNTYGLNSARGTVGSGGLSRIYNPRDYNLGGGRRIGERETDINQDVSSRLWNRGNKLLASGYNNQYK